MLLKYDVVEALLQLVLYVRTYVRMYEQLKKASMVETLCVSIDAGSIHAYISMDRE